MLVNKFFIFVILFILITAGITGIILQSLRNSPKSPASPPKIVQTKVTIIEGWTTQNIAEDLDLNAKRTEQPHLADKQEFLDAVKNFSVADYPLLSSKPASQGLEGFVFPDTYFLPVHAGPSTTESSILITKALDNFSNKFTPQMESDAAARGMSVYQIVTLASIIEKETGRNVVTDEQQKALDEQRKIIAGIFYNRLAIGMPLQSDATVNFVTKKSSPSATTEDTKTDSPYNTYLYKGLPPGPICNPSLSSILAAIYPTHTNYFYFLHKQPSGEAVYSVTYEEQLQNKQKYLQ